MLHEYLYRWKEKVREEDKNIVLIKAPCHSDLILSLKDIKKKLAKITEKLRVHSEASTLGYKI